MLIREAIEFNPEEKQVFILTPLLRKLYSTTLLEEESLIVDPATAVSISIIYV